MRTALRLVGKGAKWTCVGVGATVIGAYIWATIKGEPVKLSIVVPKPEAVVN